MWFDFFNRVLKINWAVTFNINMFDICLSNFAATAHVDVLGDEVIFFRINYWISMNRNQYFITFAMDTNAVIKVLELISWCKLHINVFADT